MRDANAYLGQLQALLPPGAAWTRDPDAGLTALLLAFADELARVDARAGDLLDEADPDTTLELLPDWERLVGLPDPCTPAGGTVRERQMAVVRKLAATGGQSRAYLVALAANAGVAVEIVEFVPFSTESRVDQELADDAWRFAFEVRALPASETEGLSVAVRFGDFDTGSRIDERLRSFGSDELECVLVRVAPAHSAVIFAYPIDPDPIFLVNFLAF